MGNLLPGEIAVIPFSNKSKWLHPATLKQVDSCRLAASSLPTIPLSIRCLAGMGGSAAKHLDLFPLKIISGRFAQGTIIRPCLGNARMRAMMDRSQRFSKQTTEPFLRLR